MSDNAQSITREEVGMMRVLDRYEAAREQILTQDPDLDAPGVRRFMDAAAHEIASEQLQTHGRIVSTPEQIARAALAETEKTLTKKQAAKPVTQQTTIGGDAFQAESNEEWADRQRAANRKLRGRG